MLTLEEPEWQESGYASRSVATFGSVCAAAQQPGRRAGVGRELFDAAPTVRCYYSWMVFLAIGIIALYEAFTWQLAQPGHWRASRQCQKVTIQWRILLRQIEQYQRPLR
jgi:hypothetical protein